jgi:hypothetical protein
MFLNVSVVGILASKSVATNLVALWSDVNLRPCIVVGDLAHTGLVTGIRVVPDEGKLVHERFPHVWMLRDGHRQPANLRLAGGSSCVRQTTPKLALQRASATVRAAFICVAHLRVAASAAHGRQA